MFAIEELIRRAMEAGKFDNLPGKGKPLRLEDNSQEDPEWRMAHHLLRSNGFSLPWIEKRQEIETELEAARGALKRSWAWRQAALAEKQPADLVEGEWGRSVQSFREKIADINKLIFSYNLEVPSDRFQRRMLDAERELTAVSLSDTL
jgi:DnaJ family protein C protein 28